MESIHNKSIMNKIRLDYMEKEPNYIKKRIVLTTDKSYLHSMNVLHISFSGISFLKGNTVDNTTETVKKECVIEYNI